jgi:hypothetical protein
MRWAIRCLTAVTLLIAGLCTASAQPRWSRPYWSQPYWGYGVYGPNARGYYGTPYGPVRNYGNGGGDQYGYGPGYSYARQAPAR